MVARIRKTSGNEESTGITRAATEASPRAVPGNGRALLLACAFAAVAFGAAPARAAQAPGGGVLEVPPPGGGDHKSAIVIVVEENESQSSSVTWGGVFQAVDDILGAGLGDLDLDLPSWLVSLINAFDRVRDEVLGFIRAGLVELASAVIVELFPEYGQCAREFLQQMKESFPVGDYDTFLDRYGEDALASCLREMAEPYYDEVVVLTDSGATFASFESTLVGLHRDGYLIDVLLDVHGCSTSTSMNNRTCATTRLSFAGGTATPADIRAINGGRPMNLNAVYMVSCWGSEFNDAWIDAGARASNGSNELNYYVLLSPIVFMQHWTRHDSSLNDAAQAAYAAEKVLMNGKRFPIEFTIRNPITGSRRTVTIGDIGITWRKVMDKKLARRYGASSNQPVDNRRSSERRHLGQLGLRRAELSAPPAPVLDVESVDPPSGSPGTVVTVTGFGFTSRTVALFDGAPMATTVLGGERLRFTVPDGASCGQHGVSVRDSGAGAETREIGFRVPGGFSIGSLRPAGGRPGSRVRVIGCNFRIRPPFPGSTSSVVLFNDREVETQVISSTELLFTVPADAHCGAHEVRVSNSRNVITDPATFRVVQPCEGGGEVVSFRRGDVNVDGGTDVSDPVSILGFLFQGTGDLPCHKSADVNDDGDVDISDAIGLLGHLFLGASAPPPPFRECGKDATADDLTCEAFAACP